MHHNNDFNPQTRTPRRPLDNRCGFDRCGEPIAELVEHPQRGPFWCCMFHATRVKALDSDRFPPIEAR